MTAPAEPRSGGAANLLRAEFERWHGRPGESAELVATVLAGLLDALPSPAWTSEAPKEIGWYWWANEEEPQGSIMLVGESYGDLRVWVDDRTYPKLDELHAEPGTRWAGPLLPPASPEGAS